MEKEWMPNVRDIVYFINVYAPMGYTQCFYKTDMRLALERNMIFKTKKEAIKKVKELGWIDYQCD